MSLNLSDEEIHGLITYARDKFAGERYPFAPTLRPIREVLAKLDPTPSAPIAVGARGLRTGEYSVTRVAALRGA